MSDDAAPRKGKRFAPKTSKNGTPNRKVRGPFRQDVRPAPSVSPLLQRMPEGRTRLDPTIRDQVAAFLLVCGEHWEKLSHQTVSGLVGEERDGKSEAIKAARRAAIATQELMTRLWATVDSEDVSKALEFIRASLKLHPLSPHYTVLNAWDEYHHQRE